MDTQAAFDSATFRKVLGQFATGVTLVTTRVGGEPWGMTANSFTSISLDPPLVMVSVGHGLTTNKSIREHGAFAVNILRADQMPIAQLFARRDRTPEQFKDFPWRPGVTQSPVLEDCLGWVDCRLHDVTEQGDHTVFFGRVEDLSFAQYGDPLLYYSGGYARIEPAPIEQLERSGALQGKLIFFEWEEGNY